MSSHSSHEIFSIMAEATKSKLFNWTSINEAADQWIAHEISMNKKWSDSDCLTVVDRNVQIKLLIPIPAEPVMPIGDPNIVPTAVEISRFGYYTSVYKGLKDAFDKATKIHKGANDSAEKAYNDYASVHAPNSRIITAHREIHRSRKAEARGIVADLARLGYTYEAAMVRIGVNAPGDVALIALLQPICNIYLDIIARATNMSILWECQDYVERNFSPGQPSQHGYFKAKIEKLRDKDISEGMNESLDCSQQTFIICRWQGVLFLRKPSKIILTTS